MKKNYGYHIIDNSPWVIYTTISILSIIITNIFYMYRYTGSQYFLLISIISLIINVNCWWEEVIKEGTIKGEHTNIVQEGLMKGYILFIVSEIIIFLSLFYSFFYCSIIPDIHIGNIWPPVGLNIVNYKSIPLLNTFLLFFSGIAITVSHYKLKLGDIKGCKTYILYTLYIGLVFVLMQYIEYKYSEYNITDSIYSNIFYVLTGVHGVHVIIGILFIYIAYIRLKEYTNEHHINYIFSSIYWHFVDIVWLFLFAIIYVWSSSI